MPDETLWKANEKNLFEFLKEYDICPSLLSKSVAFSIYLHTRNSKEPVYLQAGLDILAAINQNTGTSKRRPHSSVPPGDQTRSIGKQFTFFKFLDLIIKCAKVTFSGYSTGSES